MEKGRLSSGAMLRGRSSHKANEPYVPDPLPDQIQVLVFDLVLDPGDALPVLRLVLVVFKSTPQRMLDRLHFVILLRGSLPGMYSQQQTRLLNFVTNASLLIRIVFSRSSVLGHLIFVFMTMTPSGNVDGISYEVVRERSGRVLACLFKWPVHSKKVTT